MWLLQSLALDSCCLIMTGTVTVIKLIFTEMVFTDLIFTKLSDKKRWSTILTF